jgi:hypothetical protein
VLSHAAQTSATTARPGRVSAGLASTGRHGAPLSRADDRALIPTRRIIAHQHFAL